MPVREAQERISEAEFIDWMLWHEHKADMEERARKGEPLHDTDEADDMTPEETVNHLRMIFGQLQKGA
jgi:hypothetical protein